jgi:hypothetical protein
VAETATRQSCIQVVLIRIVKEWKSRGKTVAFKVYKLTVIAVT